MLFERNPQAALKPITGQPGEIARTFS